MPSNPEPTAAEKVRKHCTACLKHIVVRKDGTFWHHRERRSGSWYRPPVCKNSGKPANQSEEDQR